MKSRIALVAVALGVPLLVGDDAFAKGAAKRQTVQMSRTGADADAAGTITVTHKKRGDTKVITLNHLAPRTVFEVRDSASGELLGTVKTNRRGHAVFNLTKSLAKSRAKAARAGDADVSDPSNVDIVDPTTGDDVLTGDVTPPAPVPAEGYADFFDDDGDQAYVFMATDPDAGDELFTLAFYPANDPNADPETGTAFYYDLNLDGSRGQALPLGAASVADLAGRAFEIHASDGTVVLSGTLPTLDPIDPTMDEPPPFDDGGYYDDGNYYGGMPGGCPNMGDADGSFADPSQFPNGKYLPDGNSYFGTKSAKKHRGPRKDAGANPFTLFVADADGVLHDAADLVQEAYDSGWTDYPTDDPFGGLFDPYSSGGFFVVMIFVPMDGSFDFGAYLDQIMNGGFGGGADPFGGMFGDPFGGANSPAPTKHRWF